MIYAIVCAVAKALDKEFNADSDLYEIYSEEIKQDLHEPAFFVQSISPSITQFLGKRYMQRVHILIQYFPKSDEYQAECNEIGEQLAWIAEWITCKGDDRPIQGIDMHYEIVDRVLNFFVDYEFFVRRIRKDDQDYELMGILDSTQTMKEGGS